MANGAGMKKFHRLAGALLAILLMPAYAASAEQGRVIATIGSHPITQQEVDSRLKAQLTAMDSQVYDLRRKTIESMADDYLIEQAAAKAKLSVSDYLKREVYDKIPPPSDAIAKEFFDAHKAQIPQPYDKVKPQVIAFLEQQAAADQRTKLLDSLRVGEPLTIKLKPPRFQVASLGHPELGPKDAPVTIVEFGDFQCPFCKKSEDSIKDVRTKYGDKVRLVYMDFPLSFHPNALPAAEAARCAGDQAKFWQYHDALFGAQPNLKSADLKAAAAKLGLDQKEFDACLDGNKYGNAISADQAYGSTLGVEGTPAFFINGRPLSGAQPAGEFEQIIDEELASSADRVAKAHP